MRVVREGRWREVGRRLPRLLELAERWLQAELGEAGEDAECGQGCAFRFERAGGRTRLRAIPKPEPFALDDLLGVERSIQRLIRNTEQFLAGLPFNHVLLYGERGTGKSSAVRGLLTRYADCGLSAVEVRKDDFAHLPDLIALLRGRPGHFLIFADDLSFSEGEVGYRELKAALEGSLDALPRNLCLMATSNRRHLLPERRSENLAHQLDQDGDLHPGEALDEKLALSDRFGLALPFLGFDQKTYLRIVRHHAHRAGLEVDEESLHADALRWALERSSRSGRTARQFVDDLSGKLGLEVRRREFEGRA